MSHSVGDDQNPVTQAIPKITVDFSIEPGYNQEKPRIATSCGLSPIMERGSGDTPAHVGDQSGEGIALN